MLLSKVISFFVFANSENTICYQLSVKCLAQYFLKYFGAFLFRFPHESYFGELRNDSADFAVVSKKTLGLTFYTSPEIQLGSPPLLGIKVLRCMSFTDP